MKAIDQTTLRIARLDGSRLVLEGAALSDAFFTQDPSSIGLRSYDSLAGRTTVDTIETSDIEALNRTMRARTAHVRWAAITAAQLPWLKEIDPNLDLIEAHDAQWEDAHAERLVGAALASVVGEGRGVSVATKMLHLKRPRLFPILDQLVAEMLGGGISPDARADVRARQASSLVMHLRGQGRDNLPALREIQARLSEKGLNRSLVRILDAVLWSSHPAAGGPGMSRIFECRAAQSE